MKKAAVSLLELLVALILLSILVLSISSVVNFSRYHVINADKRARVQNDVSFVLAHMRKSVQRGIGDTNNPPLVTITNGFRVRVDNNVLLPTPGNYSDDSWLNYALSANTLSFSCTQVSAASPACPPAENLSTKIVSGAVFAAIPAVPASGFNYYFRDNDTTLEVALVARYDPASAASADNPEVVMKNSILARSAASR